MSDSDVEENHALKPLSTRDRVTSRLDADMWLLEMRAEGRESQQMIILPYTKT
ncbi:hypothetical protein DENSPDRAFT_831747 [Dentipellis sp. KUC8613]|nr:hypothetical protein DENSPDRAFT_831747 [Dentipellis sp. KUC8613]